MVIQRFNVCEDKYTFLSVALFTLFLTWRGYLKSLFHFLSAKPIFVATKLHRKTWQTALKSSYPHRTGERPKSSTSLCKWEFSHSSDSSFLLRQDLDPQRPLGPLTEKWNNGKTGYLRGPRLGKEEKEVWESSLSFLCFVFFTIWIKHVRQCTACGHTNIKTSLLQFRQTTQL